MNPTDRLLPAGFGLTERAVKAAVGEVLEQGVVQRMVAEAIEGGTVNAVVDELVQTGLLEKIVEALIARGLVDRVIDHAIASGMIAQVASSPDLRAALTATSSGFAGDIVGELRRRSMSADDRAERTVARVLRRETRDERPGRYRTAGFVSRLLAVAVDSVLITAASVGVTATTELVATLFAKFDVSTPLGVIAASPTSILATGAYFVLSWTLAGQTVGMRVLALRIIGPDERPPSAPRALARLLGALIAALPLFAGYLLVLVERHRLAFHDRLAGTRVVYTS